MQEWHCIRDTVVMDQVGKMMQEETLRDRHSRGENGWTKKAAME
jgi:hypothetical protein